MPDPYPDDHPDLPDFCRHRCVIWKLLCQKVWCWWGNSNCPYEQGRLMTKKGEAA